MEQSAAQGDEDAVAVLLEAGRASAARAPGAAARWFAAALRLLPADDRDRGSEVRMALASALRSAGELEACRTTVLEAIDLLPAGAEERRVELITLCAAVEHWMGRHDDAHARLTRAWEELPSADTPEAVALQIELAVDGLYEMDFDQTLAMGAAALDAARGPGRRAAGGLGGVGAGPGRGGVGGGRARRAGTATRRWSRSSGCRTPSWRPGWRRSTTWAGPRTTWSATTTRSRAPTAAWPSPARPARGACWCR